MLKYIVSPFALVLTIYIWFFVVPNYIKEIYDLKNAFNYNKEYNALYDKFIQWINQFNLEYGVKSSGVKIVFLLSWIGFGFVFMYYVDYLEIIPDGGMGNIYLCLVFVLMVLNFSSYYICMVFTFFIKNVSKIEDLKCNIYLPSTTNGFLRLKKVANITYLFFLADSFLCIFAYIDFVFLFAHKRVGLGDNLPKFFFISLYMGCFGLLSFIIITFRVKYYLHKILEKWKRRSIDILQKEYDEACGKKNESEMYELTKKIQEVRGDRIAVSKGELVAAFSTFALNIVSIITSILILLENFLI